MLWSSPLVVIILALAATVNAEECATSELMTIASSSHLEGCTSTLGFSGFSAISSLSDAQVQKVCETSACMTLMDEMRSMGFGDCTIPGTNISLESDILDPFAKECSGSGSVDLSSGSISEESVGSASGSSGATMLALTWVSTVAIAITTLVL
ncbi:hypothetical protein PRIC2_010887 [Phytophthora ramorum]